MKGTAQRDVVHLRKPPLHMRLAWPSHWPGTMTAASGHRAGLQVIVLLSPVQKRLFGSLPERVSRTLTMSRR